MGWRFRKSVNSGPFRFTLSKTGLGWSIGLPGARWTQRADGKQQTTVNLPGTGISHVQTRSMNTPSYQDPAPPLFPYVLAVLLVAGGVYCVWNVSELLGWILGGVGMVIVALWGRSTVVPRSVSPPSNNLANAVAAIRRADAVLRAVAPPADVPISPDFQLFTRLCHGLDTDRAQTQTTLHTMVADPQTRDPFTRDYGLAFLAGCLAQTPSERKIFLEQAACLKRTLSDEHLAAYHTLYDQHGELRWRIGGDDWFAFWMPIRMDDCSMEWMQIVNDMQIGDTRAAVQRLAASDLLRGNWHWGLVAAIAYEALGERTDAIRQLQHLLLVYTSALTQEEKAQIRLMLAAHLITGHDTTTALKVLNQSYSLRRHLSPETTLELGYALGRGYLTTGANKKAVNVLSEVASIQFNYKDVQDLLRQARSGGTDARPQRDSPPPPLDPWEVLGVSRQAPHAAVKQAYRALMAQYHPDKVAHLGPDLQVVAEEKAKSLNHAYHVICTQQGW
ncbi:MAG: DUF4236 domain-containing protein [Nitrospira sp.]